VSVPPQSQSPQSPEPSSSSERKLVRGRGAAASGQVSESSGGKSRRRLAPSEKYEVFVQVLTQQATQREAAEKWGVDRSTVIGICRTAKQGALDALAAAVPGRPQAARLSRPSWPRRGRRSNGCGRG